MSKKNLSIMDRIKTFEDAVKELGEKHPAVCEYNAIVSAGLETSMSPDILAYFKLRIITAALNEGWEPQFTVGEYRYWPWFWLYTQEEVDAMTEAERSELLIVGGRAYNGALCGLSSAFSNAAFSHSLVLRCSSGLQISRTREVRWSPVHRTVV